MNDFRQYKGIDCSIYLSHYGVGHDKGGHSGRYPWGSGDNPKQRLGRSEARTTLLGGVKSKKAASKSNSLKTPESKASDTDKIKNNVKAILITTAALATVGGLHHLKTTGALNRGADAINEVLNSDTVRNYKEELKNLSVGARKTYDYLVNNGFKPLTKPETEGQSLRKINPYFMTNSGQMNCYSCSFAYVLRKKLGLDVQAIASTRSRSLKEVADVVKNKSTNYIRSVPPSVYNLFSEQKDWDTSKSYLKNVETNIKKSFEDGASGLICVAWLPWYGGGGHVFNWEITDGKVVFIDAQRGHKGAVEMRKHFDRVNESAGFTAIRLDNAEFDIDKLKKMVKVN